jgi:hypothetical protein
MLIEPASKVSVPFTVVMRTRSKTSDKVFEPEPVITIVSLLQQIEIFATHVFEDKFVKVTEPCLTTAALGPPASIKNPV